MKKGILYLIPTIISPHTAFDVLPQQVHDVIKHTQYYLVETIRETRRFISSLNLDINISRLQFDKIDNSIEGSLAEQYLAPALQGKNIGILSDAGCPGIADPGKNIIYSAHKLGIKVTPLVGPSSLFLALMASGLNGQSFAFNGYLPIDQKEASTKIKEIEKKTISNGQTQLFIETPYRSNRTFNLLRKNLMPTSLLCVAKDISGIDEYIKTLPVLQWEKENLTIGKIPTVFLFQVV